ncbi:MAG: hypothetical protein ACRDGR_02300, partial [bacterium]
MVSTFVLAVVIATAAAAETTSDPFLSGGALCGGAPRLDAIEESTAEDAVTEPSFPAEIDDAGGRDLVTISWLDVPVDPVSPEIPIEV